MNFVKSFLFLILLFAGGSVFSQEIKAVKITDVEKFIAESKTPLIVNVWATWCGPCLEELPYFQKEVKEHSKDSMQLLLVSLDFKEAFPKDIKKFVDKKKIRTPVVWLDETDADYFCPRLDPKWSGAIPATLFINNKTGYRKFYEGKISHEGLKKEIMAMLEIH